MHTIGLNDERKNITIKDLPEGHTCVYKIKATCSDVQLRHDSKPKLLNFERSNDTHDWDERSQETDGFFALGECKDN